MSGKRKEPNLDFLEVPIDPRAALKKIIAFEAWGVIVLALTVVYILGLTGRGGPVGEIIVAGVKPVLGYIGAWILALAMLVGTVHLLAAGKIPVAGRLTRLTFWATPLILGAWESGMYLRRFYWDEQARKAVGYIGLWLGRGLRLLVGDYAVPVALGLIVVLTFIIMRLSPKAILLAIWRGFIGLFKSGRTRVIHPPTQEIEEERDIIMSAGDEPASTEFSIPETVFEPQVPAGEQIGLGLDDMPPLPKPKHYKLPPIKLLDAASPPIMDDDYREFASQRIVKTLDTFGIPCQVSEVITGPAVTRVEVVLGEGIRVKQVEGMEKDIAYTLPAKRVRVEAPIPGKTAVGIEFPNIRTNIVRLSEVVQTKEWQKARAPLTMSIAKDLNNRPVLANLSGMPHLLVAGQTGSGKSVCLHAIIMSFLYRLTPDHLRLILIDPKMVEFGFYEGLPHLLTPVVNDVSDAVNALRWSVQEMRDRYRRLKSAKARNIQTLNQMVPAEERLPYIVIVIDEMADLMAQEGYEIEACITSLTQLARAVGIHLILATQRPSVKIITGNIKGNIPARIALNVASYNDSRTILDYKGAETLLGNGDMLYKPVDDDTPLRCQGVYVDDEEIKRVVEFLAKQGSPDYDDDVTADRAPSKPGKGGDSTDMASHDSGLYRDAILVFMNEGEASTSMLQSKLGLGYPRARRLMEQMEEMGLVGPKNGSRPRELMFSACRDALNDIEGTKASNIDDPTSLEDNNVDEILAEV